MKKLLRGLLNILIMLVLFSGFWIVLLFDVVNIWFKHLF